MPNRGLAVDPFVLKEGSRRIPASVSIPISWLAAVRHHTDSQGVSISEYLMAALEAHAKKTGLELPEIQR